MGREGRLKGASGAMRLAVMMVAAVVCLLGAQQTLESMQLVFSGLLSIAGGQLQSHMNIKSCIEPSPLVASSRRCEIKSVPAPTAQPTFDMIVGLSHHKTGTFQLRCLMKHWSQALGIPNSEDPCFKDHSVNSWDLSNCYTSRTTDPNIPFRKPVFFKTFHGIKQICHNTYNITEAWEPCLSFMVAKYCNRAKVEGMLRSPSECTIGLPNDLNLGFLNFIRNPIDSVVSAYAFHLGGPRSEPWLHRPMNLLVFTNYIQWAGADRYLINENFKLTREFRYNEKASYLDVLRRIPPEDGILLEYYHSLPEILSNARQYMLLKDHRGAFNVRFEDLKYEFNSTMLDAIRFLNMGSLAPEQLLDVVVAGGCDPNTWSETERAANDHLTDGKYQTDKEAAVQRLLAHPPAKQTLCKLVKDMAYEDPRCAGMGSEEDNDNANISITNDIITSH